MYLCYSGGGSSPDDGDGEWSGWYEEQRYVVPFYVLGLTFPKIWGSVKGILIEEIPVYYI